MCTIGSGTPIIGLSESMCRVQPPLACEKELRMSPIVAVVLVFLTIALAGLTQLQGLVDAALGPFRFLFQ